MRAYIIRRLLLMIPTLLVLSFAVYFLISLVPGDVIDAMLAVPGADQEVDREMLEKKLGLDAPLIVQYARWMGMIPRADGIVSGVFQGNFGVSWWTRKPVVDLMLQRWPVTIELGLLGMVIAQLIALPIDAFNSDAQTRYFHDDASLLAVDGEAPGRRPLHKGHHQGCRKCPAIPALCHDRANRFFDVEPKIARRPLKRHNRFWLAEQPAQQIDLVNFR